MVLGGCSPATPTLSSPNPNPLLPDPGILVSREPLVPVTPPYSLAILPFEDYSNRKNLSWLRQAIPDMLVTDLALLPGVRVVSRQRLGEVLREQWLQQRGTFAESASVRLGKLVGARYLLTGMYYFGGDVLVVEGHLIDVERGAVVRTVRVSGAPESIPSIEMEFASRLGGVFSNAPGVEGPSDVQQGKAKYVEEDVIQDPGRLFDDHADSVLKLEQGSNPFNSTMALRTDSLLRMERLRDVRNSAARFANEIWTEAVATQLGTPEYQPLSRDALPNAQRVNVLIPVVATIQGGWFHRVQHHVNVLEGEKGRNSHTLILTFQSEDPGAQQLFVEAMHGPRRLFIRAIGEGGEVLGVSSQWAWRVDQFVHIRSDGSIELSVAPQILLEGRTTFDGGLMVKHGATIRFDSTIVPVPNEARILSIEPILEEVPPDGVGTTQLTWLPILRTWLLEHWTPTITESIPVGGYLPGNVRRSIAVLEGSGGTIQAAQVVQVETEEMYAKSIQDVVSQLPGQCFAHCDQTNTKKSLPFKVFKIRVQFELIKDIRFVGLNKKS